MKREPPKHRTFLITIWEERGRNSHKWRFLLANSHNESRNQLTSLESVIAELERRVRELQQKAS